MSCELITPWLPVAETHTQEEGYFPSISVTLTYNQSLPLPVSTALPQPPPTFLLLSFLLLFFFFFFLYYNFFFIIQKSSFQVQTKFKGEKVKKVSWPRLFRKGRTNWGL